MLKTIRSISKAWKGKGGGGSKAVETGNHGTMFLLLISSQISYHGVKLNNAIPGRSGEVVFKLEEDTNMKKLLKEKVMKTFYRLKLQLSHHLSYRNVCVFQILNERRDWEHDLRLIDQLYDDDYDDQVRSETMKQINTTFWMIIVYYCSMMKLLYINLLLLLWP
jgi:hypothetical protein